MSRGRLLRYAPYQLWDYVLERGLITLLLVALTLGPPIAILRHEHGAGWALTAEGVRLIRRVLVDVAVPLATLIVLFAINGISSVDRQKGFFRFLFAKPVMVPAYYAQDLVLRFVGVLGIGMLSALAVSLTSGAPFPWNLVAYVALVFVLLGGIGFLLSALFQFDGLYLILVWIASAIVFQIRTEYPRWVPAPLTWILPPVDKLEVARNAWLGGVGALSTPHLWWVIGYGLGCFVLGLVALRRRPLAR